MAKGKNGGVQNRAIYSRVSFLQQAATFLSTSLAQQRSASNSNAAAAATTTTTTMTTTTEGLPEGRPQLLGISRRLATDLRSVSLKTRIRLSPAVKQSICKFCDSILIEGHLCTSIVENRSRGGRKPWADVMVRKCHTCGRERRYPISATRPKRKTERDEGDDVVKSDTATRSPEKQAQETGKKQAG
ncbi:ribonuclease P protein component 4 [Podospora aff. communis PSN243]|uniref:Ribonuclease P protein component 4 n=1 Tax=Podospora aff. communis PSN243 TaxID=3040156 RepID=A0AAV9H034_9PEZI|nr:ribonuclease P protein component 4 [Podospora aff. communis PSN243]